MRPFANFTDAAEVDCALVQQILAILKRKREPDIKHHSQSDDLEVGFVVSEWGSFCHLTTLQSICFRLKPVSPPRTDGRKPRAAQGRILLTWGQTGGFKGVCR